MLNEDITHYVQLVAQQSDARSATAHQELDSIIGFIGLFMLLALLITGYAGYTSTAISVPALPPSRTP